MEWHHQLPKIKVQTYAGKVMAGFFWSSEGILSVEFVERGAIINSEQYFADIKVVQTTNLKGLSKQEDELIPPPAWQCQTAHKGGSCNNGVDCFHSSSLQSWYSTH
jgi:hypothetical protein